MVTPINSVIANIIYLQNSKMNKNIMKSNVESENSSFVRSVSKETKAHFDSLLKNALHKNDKSKKELYNQTREKLPTKSRSLDNGKVNNLPTETQEEQPDNFILEKFLSDAVNARDIPNKNTAIKQGNELKRSGVNSITFIKSPVPLPRSSTRTTIASTNRTYSVCSPKLNNNLISDIERISTCSNNTYNVEKPTIINKVHEIDTASLISTGTYSISNSLRKGLTSTRISSASASEQSRRVGEIEIHDITSTKSIVKVLNKSKKTSNFNSTSDIEYKDTTFGHKKEDKIEEKQVESLKKTKTDKKNFKRLSSIESPNIKEPIYTYEDLLGIVIYKTDKLLLTPVISQPCVKIHLVDGETGEYLSRSRAVEENGTMKLNNIYPLITKSYELQQHKSLIPYWEELVVFDEDFRYILENKDSVIIFFEILDFLSFTDASLKYKKEGSNSGWHRIAWAFLKLTGKSGQLNVDQNLRLQLYKSKKTSIKRRPNECILFDWWKTGSLSKYPSTLHVSVRSVRANYLKETLHSDSVYKSELHMNIVHKEVEKDQAPEKICCDPVNWSRSGTQPCKMPNNIKAKLKSGKKGCFAIKFSNEGLYLACGIAIDDVKSAIIVYSVLEKTEYCKLAGHQGIIYNLFWSADDKYLISSSADCTVYLWNVYKKQFHAKQVLPHPSFVYCAVIQLKVVNILTGCYDQILRVWKANAVESNYELYQELEGHEGYITSLCFGDNKNVLYSSDSVGIIIEWSLDNLYWQTQRTFKLQELQKTLINNIVVHPGGKRMVVFCRESTHRMIDLTIGCVSQWYRGITNYRVHTNGTLSPCGCLIFSPSEDGHIYVWNTDTGTLLATFNPYVKMIKQTVIPHILHFHPLDNYIAISHYGSNIPILFCTYENNAQKIINLLFLKTFVGNVNPYSHNGSRDSPRKDLKKRKPGGKTYGTDTKSEFNTIIDKIDDVISTARTN